MIEKLLFFSIPLIFAVHCGCSSIDCHKCPPIIKVEYVKQNFNCKSPEPFMELLSSLKSPDEAKSERELIEIITFNVLKMENQLKQWEIYFKCIQTIQRNLQRNLNEGVIDEKN